MRKRRVTPIGAAFVALVLLVLLFVVRGALHRPAHVVLPQDASSSDVSDASLDDSAVGRIAVRPDTVQSAIATLERPARYSRAITIERYYSGGSGVDRSSVSVDGAWMRVDTEQASGAQSHTISNGERTWVWYGGSELYYESAAAFTADEEQGIPTYEDILRLDKKRIAAADYRLLDTVDCIFVETAADDGGYIERYWVSVSNGLLCAAEKLQGEDVVYRMAGMSVDSGNVAENAFTLPDGTPMTCRMELTLCTSIQRMIWKTSPASLRTMTSGQTCTSRKLCAPRSIRMRISRNVTRARQIPKTARDFGKSAARMSCARCLRP